MKRQRQKEGHTGEIGAPLHIKGASENLEIGDFTQEEKRGKPRKPTRDPLKDRDDWGKVGFLRPLLTRTRRVDMFSSVKSSPEMSSRISP